MESASDPGAARSRAGVGSLNTDVTKPGGPVLQLLVPAAGCSLMMLGCLFVMRRSHAASTTSSAADELAQVRRELVDLRDRALDAPAGDALAERRS